jgi:predicted metal-dependent hydrolase
MLGISELCLHSCVNKFKLLWKAARNLTLSCCGSRWMQLLRVCVIHVFSWEKLRGTKKNFESGLLYVENESGCYETGFL